MRLALVLLSCLPLVGQTGGVIGIGGGSGGGGRRMQPRNTTEPPQMPTGKGSIEGTVTNSVTHQPIKKATVTLYGMGQLLAVTDEAGHFAFRQLPKGMYTVQAQSSAFPQQNGIPKIARINLNEEEAKTSVDLTLTPGGTINGRTVDEEGNAMAGCNIGAMEVDATSGVRRLNMRMSGNTDDRGEFHLTNVPKGKYYVIARCFSNIPLPHAFLRRGPDTEIPTLSYDPVLYPSSTDLAGATAVSVAPGADVSGLEFRMTPAAGATVRGRVGSSEPEAPGGFVQVMLIPEDPALRDVRRKNAMYNRQTGAFRFEHVPPGSYEVIAITRGPDATLMARSTVVVGTGEIKPVELLLEHSQSVKGTVVVDDDSKQSMESMQVMLQPREGESYAPPPQARVQKDGSFLLQNVTPGKWNISVMGMNGFMKSLAVAGQESSAEVLDFTSGVSGPLKLTISTKWAQVTGSVTGMPAQQTEMMGAMLPANQGPMGQSMRMFAVQPDGRFVVPNLNPGEFYGCVLPVMDGWSLMRNAQFVNQIKSRCTSVQVTEGDQTSSQVPFIAPDDLQRMLEDADR
jgi:hypothetical protein